MEFNPTVPTQLPPPDAPASPFVLRQLTGTDVLLHLIDLQAGADWLRETNDTRFFARLSDEANQRGYRLVHLWEDVWRSRPALVRSRLNALTGRSERIPARLTQFRRIDRPTANAFLAEHHLQVVTGAKYNYGLWLPARYFRVLSDAFLREQSPDPASDLLVAVATFSQPRTIPRDGQLSRSYELIRFANRQGTTIVGGLDKLLRGFMTAHAPAHDPEAGTTADLMTYADRDWSDGRGYTRLGFTNLGAVAPQQFWLDPTTLTRHYPHRVPVTDPVAAGFLPVVNAGGLKFIRMLDR